MVGLNGEQLPVQIHVEKAKGPNNGCVQHYKSLTPARLALVTGP